MIAFFLEVTILIRELYHTNVDPMHFNWKWYLLVVGVSFYTSEQCGTTGNLPGNGRPSKLTGQARKALIREAPRRLMETLEDQ